MAPFEKITIFKLHKYKFMTNFDDPFKVLERVNNSFYKMERLEELMSISPTFNVRDLSPYLDDSNLRTNSSK